MAIARTTRTKNHITPIDGALVHLSQMDSAEVNLEGALITEGLEADIAFDSLLACCRICSQLVEDLFVVHC